MRPAARRPPSPRARPRPRLRSLGRGSACGVSGRGHGRGGIVRGGLGSVCAGAGARGAGGRSRGSSRALQQPPAMHICDSDPARGCRGRLGASPRRGRRAAAHLGHLGQADAALHSIHMRNQVGGGARGRTPAPRTQKAKKGRKVKYSICEDDFIAAQQSLPTPSGAPRRPQILRWRQLTTPRTRRTRSGCTTCVAGAGAGAEGHAPARSAADCGPCERPPTPSPPHTVQGSTVARAWRGR